jgi:cell division septum initiation protein DivIVA
MKYTSGHAFKKKEELNQLRRELEGAKSRSSASRAEIQAIADSVDEVLYREEMMWLQRSRISWLKEGGHNTRFFHMQAKWHARKNKIRKLNRVDGS